MADQPKGYIPKSLTLREIEAAFLGVYRILGVPTLASVPSMSLSELSGKITDATLTDQHNEMLARDTASAHPADTIDPDTTNFDRALSAADSTVQAALETLDTVAVLGVGGLTTHYRLVAVDSTAGKITQIANIYTDVNGNLFVQGTSKVYQAADDAGIQIFGFDDRSGNWLKLEIDASGYANIDALTGFRFKMNGANVAYVDSTPANGIRLYDNLPVSFGTTAATRFSVGYLSASDEMVITYGGGITTPASVIYQLSKTGDIILKGTFRPKATLRNVATYTANQTLDADDDAVICKTNAFTITLPSVAVADTGKTYDITNAASNPNDIELDADGAETINNVLSWTIPPGTSLTVLNDGAEWHII